MFKNIVFVICSYLFGSISFAYIICKLYSVDITQFGSKNPGATNVLRVLGKKQAMMVFLADFLKGFLVVIITKYLVDYKLALICGIAVVIGHNWSIFLKLKGGKGIATSFGVLIGLTPKIALILLIIGLTVIAIFKYVSLASLTAAFLYPLLIILFKYSYDYIIYSFILAGMAIYRHKENIQRLLSGTEHKIGEKVN